MLKALIIVYQNQKDDTKFDERWPYFIKNLEEFGIITTLITSENNNLTDEFFNNKIKTIHVPYKERFKEKLKTETVKKVTVNPSFFQELYSEMKNLIVTIHDYFTIPDLQVQWTRKVIPIVNKLLSSENFDFIITTGPPHSVHLVGLAAIKKHEIHWIADFESPWRENFPSYSKEIAYPADHKDVYFENEVLTNADTVITSNRIIKNILSKKIPRQKNKFYSIINGLDFSNFNAIKIKNVKNKIFTIVHIGDCIDELYYKKYIDEIRKLIENNSELEMRFILVGNVSEYILTNLLNISRLQVIHHTYLPKNNYLEEVLNADLLLKFLPVEYHFNVLSDSVCLELISSGISCFFIGNLFSECLKPYADQNIKVFSENNIQEFKESILTIYNSKRKKNLLNRKLRSHSKLESTRELSNLMKRRLEIDKKKIDSLYLSIEE